MHAEEEFSFLFVLFFHLFYCDVPIKSKGGRGLPQEAKAAVGLGWVQF